MSGATVFRCQLGSGDSLALKCWPDRTAPARIREVHHVMQQARNHGCECVPRVHSVAPGTKDRPETVFSHGKRYWDLTEWMPGEPPSGAVLSRATLDQVRAGAFVIARFHQACSRLGAQHGPPPAVLARLARLGELESLVPQALELADPLGTAGERAPELHVALQDACRLVQRNWNEVSRRIARSLSQYVDQKVRIQYVLRDIHREHILFTGGKPTGLIDFDAVRIDTTATDLARWVGGFLVPASNLSDLDSENVWDAAVAGYHDNDTLKDGIQTELDVPMARDLCFATTWISLGNWLVWLLLQRREFPAGPQAVVARLHELTASATLGV